MPHFNEEENSLILNEKGSHINMPIDEIEEIVELKKKA